MSKDFLQDVPDTIKHVSWKRIWVSTVTTFIVIGIGFGVFISYASSYEGRVLSGVHIGDVHVGGMDQEALMTFLQEMNDKLIDAGITLRFDDHGVEHVVRIPTSVVTTDNFIELIHVDIPQEVQRLLSYQKEGNLLVRAWSALLVRATQPQLELETVTLDTTQLKAFVAEQLTPYSIEPIEATVKIDQLVPLAYHIVSSTDGVTFSYDDIIGKITASWNVLQIPEIDIVRTEYIPSLTQEDVAAIVPGVSQLFGQDPLVLTYIDPETKKEHHWTITDERLSTLIDVQRDEDEHVVFGVDASSTKRYLAEVVEPDIAVEAQEPKFSIGSNGRVNEFQRAQAGVSLDLDATYDRVNMAVRSRAAQDADATSSIAIITTVVEPDVDTSEANDLGISELLGTGYSNFSGSPTNRVKNIRFAVSQKLNGTLIKPDEEFSLLNALKPFTVEGGYLPELVIKGDEITPEVGGGLCQVGSTLFRAVMNAGMDVTQRQNHSLVVSYYNDHRNGNPGTDATIYDPAPDFRFINDTGHYILLTTSMNEKTGDLYFSFWGTSDGRTAYYTEPVVHKWIPTGPEQTIETTDLAPGKKDCQSAHPGAETSFTYVRTLASGETQEEVFTSYYRPLPKICLVGVDPNSLPSSDDSDTVDTQDPACEFLPDGNVSCTQPSSNVPNAEDSIGVPEGTFESA